MSSSSLSPHYTERPGLFRRVHDFLHAREVPFGTAAVRILLPWALMGAMVPRWPHTRELFSTDGAPTPLWESYGTLDMLPVPSGAMAVALHCLLLFSLVAMSAGWRTRIACVLSFVLYTYLNLLDAVSTITKYSCIASHVLLLLSFSRCGLVWSVDAWLARRRLMRAPGSSPQPDLTDCAAPRRMIQLLVGMVYFGAAVTKMQTAAGRSVRHAAGPAGYHGLHYRGVGGAVPVHRLAGDRPPDHARNRGDVPPDDQPDAGPDHLPRGFHFDVLRLHERR